MRTLTEKAGINALVILLGEGRCRDQVPIARRLACGLKENMDTPMFKLHKNDHRLRAALEGFNAHPLGLGETDKKYLPKGDSNDPNGEDSD